MYEAIGVYMNTIISINGLWDEGYIIDKYITRQNRFTLPHFSKQNDCYQRY